MGPNGQAQYWAPDLGSALGVLMAHYAHTYVVPGESGPRRVPDDGPVRPRRHDVPAHLTGERLHDGRGDLLRREQPRAQEGLRHPHRDARGRRPGPRDAGALGRDGRRGHRGGVRRAPRRLAGVPAGDRVPAGAAARLPAHRRAGHLHRGHAVPEVVEEGGAGDQRGQRQPAARGAGQPVRLRRLAGLDAPPAAGVRRGDRPGDRELRRPDRVLRDLALPRRRVRGVLEGAEPADDRARGRGAPSPRSSAAPPPRPWCSPARSTSERQPTRGCQELEERIARAAEPDRVAAAARAGRPPVDAAGREDQRGGGRVRQRARHPPGGRGRAPSTR